MSIIFLSTDLFSIRWFTCDSWVNKIFCLITNVCTCTSISTCIYLLSWIKTPPALILHTCAREWHCWRAAGLSCSLVHDKQQVLGLAKLPSKPRKRHTGAAWERQNNGLQVWCVATNLHRITRWDSVAVTRVNILTVMRAEEIVHWAYTGKCDGSGM